MRFLEPIYRDRALGAVRARIIRKQRLNKLANGIFHVLTLGMLPQFRLRIFGLEQDRKAESAELYRIFPSFRKHFRVPGEVVNETTEQPTGDSVD